MENRTYFGNWKIVEHLGSGSFGDVYKIKKEEFGSAYYSAMKVIHIPQDSAEKKRLYSEGMTTESITEYYSQLARDFVKEIEVMASLQGNTNIVGYNDHLIEPNADGMGYTIYIRMEYLTPLDTYLSFDNKARFMSKKAVIKLGIDMCNALEVCERKNIIHRDIKPGNIFVSSNGDYKLGDFGIARKLDKTQSGLSRKGTLDYMAPEVYRGDNYDGAVDIYSLGMVIYRLLNCNRVPFLPLYPEQIKYNDSEVAFQKRMSGENIPYIKGVEPELNAVVCRACEFDPKRRYKNAREFKSALINADRIISYHASKGNMTFAAENRGKTVHLSNSPTAAAAAKSDRAAVRTASSGAVKPAPAKKPIAEEKKRLDIIIAAGAAAVVVIGLIVGFISVSQSKKRQLTTKPTTTVTTTKKPTTKKATTKKTTKKQTTKKTTKKQTTKKTTTTEDYTPQTTSYTPPETEYTPPQTTSYTPPQTTQAPSPGSDWDEEF